MFRYFYRIWDKFRYKNKDKSEVVVAAIYTYKGGRGKVNEEFTNRYLNKIASNPLKLNGLMAIFLLAQKNEVQLVKE